MLLGNNKPGIPSAPSSNIVKDKKNVMGELNLGEDDMKKIEAHLGGPITSQKIDPKNQTASASLKLLDGLSDSDDDDEYLYQPGGSSGGANL